MTGPATDGAPDAPDVAPDRAPLPEAVAALPDVPGAVATRADVLAAREAALAARGRFGSEAGELRAAARRTFDLRQRARDLPGDLAEDPRRAAGIALAGAGTLFGILTLRRRRRRRDGLLPAEIEALVTGFGKDAPKVRAALEESFSRYLVAHGIEPVSRRPRIPPAVGMAVAPIVAQVGRTLVKRMMERPTPPPAEGEDEPGPGGG